MSAMITIIRGQRNPPGCSSTLSFTQLGIKEKSQNGWLKAVFVVGGCWVVNSG